LRLFRLWLRGWHCLPQVFVEKKKKVQNEFKFFFFPNFCRLAFE